MIKQIADAIYAEMDVADGLTPDVAERYAHAAIKALRGLTNEAATLLALRLYGYANNSLTGLVNQGSLNIAAAHWNMMLDQIVGEDK
jgi:hypothetical protein